MKTSDSNAYALRIAQFRLLQAAIADVAEDDVINLAESTADGVLLDKDATFTVDSLPTSGDYVYVSVSIPQLMKCDPADCKAMSKDAPLPLETLSIHTLDQLIRVMKKALIICQTRTL